MVEPAFMKDAILDIAERINGRICWERNNCQYLAWAVRRAGHGDHLEIGTLHGGTAILAVKVKERYGLSGDVYCIDPLDGYYTGTKFAHPTDWVSKVPVTVEVLLGNLETFGVADRVHIMRNRSIPFPAQLQSHVFASAYIDGDHWDFAPSKDWDNCAKLTSRIIVFDNNDEKHPAVRTAVARAKEQWDCILEDGITAVFERRSHDL